MSKTAKGLLIAVLCVLATWTALASLYARSISEELTLLRRESRSDTVYLRCRIRELESELKVHASTPVGSIPTAPAETENATAPAVPETDAPSEHPTEEVTVPIHQSPETQPPSPEDDPASPPASPYLIAEHEGIICLFDASGALLRSVNVFTMTLPAPDREALSVGIPVDSWEEAMEILDSYE